MVGTMDGMIYRGFSLTCQPIVDSRLPRDFLQHILSSLNFLLQLRAAGEEMERACAPPRPQRGLAEVKKKVLLLFVLTSSFKQVAPCSLPCWMLLTCVLHQACPMSWWF